MDRLLEKLRQNMAELSVQGDDFTRQIWQMYATFEEFLEARTSGVSNRETSVSSRDVSGSTSGGTSRAISRRRSRSGGRQVIGGSALELAVMQRQVPASTPISTSAPAAPSIEFSFDSSAELRNSKDDMSLVFKRSQHHRCRYRRTRRRVDTGNPLLETISAIHDVCEADDHDGEPVSQLYASRENRIPGSRMCFDFEKDPVGYAGSNSIDSGYKSSCPTPEPSDSVVYGSESMSRRGSIASQQNPKPRIAMGTKVINRHSQFAGRDLDHLMYLRQSIVSAMQRYEQQAVASSPSPGFRPRSSSASSPSYRSASPGSSSHQRRPLMTSCPSSRTHSPCYSSASNGSGKSSPGFHHSRFVTAEEEIDSLLYGRTEELPCSYVAMIEDKYRRSSVARVKKLREKSRRGIGAPESSSSSDSCPSPIQSPESGRFSEVAKCMLEIIEDLQNQTQFAGSGPELSPPAPAPSSGTSPTGCRSFVDTEKFQTMSLRRVKGGSEKAASTIAPRPGTDFHVYEEIIYDVTSPRTEQAPPPLPARPDAMGRSNVSPRKPPTLHLPSPLHRPKQRSNIYQLFREPATRRDVSQSLEYEFRTTRERPRSHVYSDQEEYGFRLQN